MDLVRCANSWLSSGPVGTAYSHVWPSFAVFVRSSMIGAPVNDRTLFAIADGFEDYMVERIAFWVAWLSWRLVPPNLLKQLVHVADKDELWISESRRPSGTRASLDPPLTTTQGNDHVGYC
jgi:hypothetical protein